MDLLALVNLPPKRTPPRNKSLLRGHKPPSSPKKPWQAPAKITAKSCLILSRGARLRKSQKVMPRAFLPMAPPCDIFGVQMCHCSIKRLQFLWAAALLGHKKQSKYMQSLTVSKSYWHHKFHALYLIFEQHPAPVQGSYSTGGCSCGRSAGGDKGAAVEPAKTIYVDKKKKDKDKQTERQIEMEKTHVYLTLGFLKKTLSKWPLTKAMLATTSSHPTTSCKNKGAAVSHCHASPENILDVSRCQKPLQLSRSQNRSRTSTWIAVSWLSTWIARIHSTCLPINVLLKNQTPEDWERNVFFLMAQ